jgi:hypothetical protein
VLASRGIRREAGYKGCGPPGADFAKGRVLSCVERGRDRTTSETNSDTLRIGAALSVLSSAAWPATRLGRRLVARAPR